MLQVQAVLKNYPLFQSISKSITVQFSRPPVQRRLLVYLVADHDWPEHLEEVRRSVNLYSEVHRHQVIRNLLQH